MAGSSSIEDIMQIQVSHYPQLQMLCWNRDANACLTGEEAFSIYERNWRFIDAETLTKEEQALIDDLVERYGPLLIAS
ncbi:hypothetical protein QE369_003524 [Agrobacterium larrymoorei]|uniref:Uncharacterized protein n=2 Tax=Agrobacterium larrymoorei TaxID=160699 RepID=A0AAJ2BE68_9HYPH|nr:hypothetical protein [Agrobacterium larrymoorei]